MTRRSTAEVPTMAHDPPRRQLAETALAADLRRWRRAHPDATLAEVEQALDARLAPVRAALLAEVAGDVLADEGDAGSAHIRPTIVCLCGSTRFWPTFRTVSLAESIAGRIVLSIGDASGADDEHFGTLPRAEYVVLKDRLADLHLRKIDLADEVLILNCGDYVGESTARELAYARANGKRVRWWEPTWRMLTGEKVVDAD